MTEVRALKLRDIPRVYRVARKGGLQDPLLSRTHAFSPLEMAMLSMFSRVGAGTFTFVAGSDEANCGVAQLRHRGERPEAELVFLAPRLSDDRIKDLWASLIDHMSREMQGEGLMRLYARLPVEGPETDLFRELGFSLYTRETILELRPDRPVNADEGRHVETVYGCSKWHLWKLYSNITPPLVQWADGAISGEAPAGWDCMRGQVISWQKDGALMGAISLSPCRKGCLMQALLQEPIQPDAMAFLRKGIAILRNTCNRTIYTAVRSYQAGLQRALVEIGFEPVDEFISAVRHIAMRQAVPERAAQAVEGAERVIAGLSPSHMNMQAETDRKTIRHEAAG